MRTYKILAGILVLNMILSIQITGQKSEKNRYLNPLLNTNFPDPTVISAHDSFFYAYATKTILDGKPVHIQVARSKDLVAWEHLGDALPEKPVWAQETEHFWAPHVQYCNKSGLYYLYYSAYPDNGGGKCLAVATSSKPEGPFLDKGEPILCGESFVNIDPMTFDDPQSGKTYMIWGSGFQPIKIHELTHERLSFKTGSQATELIFPGKDKDYNILVEGAWLHYKNGYYYLFYSGDNCCGENANYAVMVARSMNVLGPYERYGEFNGTQSSVIMQHNEKWNAPGHNSILTDDAGNDWIFYHAIDSSDPAHNFDSHGKRLMMMDKIYYENGWPKVKKNAPSIKEMNAPEIKRK